MARKTDEQLVKEWKRKPGGFGSVRQLPSGRFQASFKRDKRTYKAPHTFAFDYDDARRRNGDGAREAENWLQDQYDLIRAAELSGNHWQPPEAQQAATMTVAELVDAWLAGSTAIKKESTRQSHRRKLNQRVLLPSFPGFDSLAHERVIDVDRKRIALWWAQVQDNWPTEQSTNTFGYKRLHTAFEYARTELELIAVNPVQIKGANAEPRSENRDKALISVAEAKAIADNAPARLKAPVLVLQWCGLRLGELLELRRKDITDNGGVMTIRVRRNVQRIKDEATGKQVMLVLNTPKTDAGNRDIVVPANVAKEVRKHLADFVAPGQESLFVTTNTGQQMMDTTFRSRFNPATKAAGRPDITPHDLRRFYGTMLVTRGGVSLEEARRLMGHETTAQLMEYQRASANYESTAATNLNNLVEASE